MRPANSNEPLPFTADWAAQFTHAVAASEIQDDPRPAGLVLELSDSLFDAALQIAGLGQQKEDRK